MHSLPTCSGVEPCHAAFCCNHLPLHTQVRRNVVLVYELLDEIIDYGFPQSSSSEAVKEFVLNEPIIVKGPVRQSMCAFSCTLNPATQMCSSEC